MKMKLTAVLTSTLLSISLNASSEVEELKAQVKALQEQSNTLAEEVLNISSGGFTTVKKGESYSGLGEAASKVYYSESPLSIGGYGEMYWAKTEGERAFADVYRFIPYFGYKFNDWIVLNTELEFEHGGEEVAIEFMYLDFLLNKSFNIRVGNLLVPMGITNLRHEPTLFNTVQRLETERFLIPSTWHENGVLVYGDIGDSGFSYTAGAINALNVNSAFATDLTSAKREEWIRQGRQGSGEKAPFKAAFTGRLDYKGINGLLLGASVYYGDGSNLKAEGADISGTNLSMFDIHAVYEKGGFNAKALYTQTNLSGARKLGADTTKKASGYYVNTSYDIGQVLPTGFKIPLFAQYESYNPIEETVSGLGESEDINIITTGLNFYPTEQVVLKADYQIKDDKNKADKEYTASFGIGFIF